jgi:hypothetical protein
MLEDDIEGRIHKTIWLPEGKVSFSVSGINQTLSYLIIAFWVVVTVYVAYKYVGSPPLDFDYLRNISAWWQLIIIAVVVAFGVGWLLRQTSSLRGTLPKLDGNHADVPIKRCSRWHRRDLEPPKISCTFPVMLDLKGSKLIGPVERLLALQCIDYC